MDRVLRVGGGRRKHFDTLPTTGPGAHVYLVGGGVRIGRRVVRDGESGARMQSILVPRVQVPIGAKCVAARRQRRTGGEP